MNSDQQHDGQLSAEDPAADSAAKPGDDRLADGRDDDYRLAAVGSQLTAWDAAIQKKLEEDARHPPFIPVEMPEETVRFSVREALILTAFAAVLLGGLQFFRPDIFAGVLGIIAFLSLVGLSVIKPKLDIFHVGWWVLLMVYLIVSVVAAIRS